MPPTKKRKAAPKTLHDFFVKPSSTAVVASIETKRLKASHTPQLESFFKPVSKPASQTSPLKSKASGSRLKSNSNGVMSAPAAGLRRTVSSATGSGSRTDIDVIVISDDDGDEDSDEVVVVVSDGMGLVGKTGLGFSSGVLFCCFVESRVERCSLFFCGLTPLLFFSLFCFCFCSFSLQYCIGITIGEYAVFARCLWLFLRYFEPGFTT